MDPWYIPSIIGIAYFFYVKFIDWRKSLKQPLHTTGEATKSSRISSGPLKGYFSLKKSMLKTFAVAGPIISCVYFFHPSAASILGVMAIFIHIVVAKDIKKMKARLEKQREVLRDIRDGKLTEIPIILRADNYGKTIYYAYPTFIDVRVYADDYHPTVAAVVLFEKLQKIAAKPESEWFKVGRAD